MRLYDLNRTGNISAFYENAQGDSITFDVCLSQGVIQMDTEEAAAQERLKIHSHDAVLVEKNGYQLVWLDTETSRLFHLNATALSREEIIALAENIIKMS